MALLTKRPIPRRFNFAKYALPIVKEYSQIKECNCKNPEVYRKNAKQCQDKMVTA